MVEQVFQCIAIRCLDQIQANEACVTQQQDVECLHQMRVGLRRLRCALSLFEKQIQLAASLQKELAWLDGELGAAREGMCFAVLPSHHSLLR
jgi:triphosphatase